MTLDVGMPAPDFDMVAADGRQLRLADFRGKKNVVVYFYPADFTLVCTRETCGFRDAYADLASKDTEVIGISVDDDTSHQKFAAEYRVPFALVSDPDRKLVDQFSAAGGFVRKLMKKAARVTYVIDKQGKIAGVFRGELSAATHVDGVKALIAKLSERS
jgi:peroxiredoxin Q/BCP